MQPVRSLSNLPNKLWLLAAPLLVAGLLLATPAPALAQQSDAMCVQACIDQRLAAYQALNAQV